MTAETDKEDVMHLNESKPCRSLPVDRGWAWVVLMASSAILIILQGNVRTFGLFYLELQRNFQASSSAISMVLGMQWVANCLSSFLALNCLSNIFSCRTLIITGSILSALCFILDSLASNALMLTFFHLLNGAGIAFIYGPCFVNIGHYFKRYRGTANALASCGASVGQFLFSPLVLFLISEYGIKGALLLNSGIFLQCIIFAMLLRPISFFEKSSSKDTYLSAIPSYSEDTSPNKQNANTETESNKNVGANSNSKNSECINPEQEERKSLLTDVKVYTEAGKKNAKNKVENEMGSEFPERDHSTFRNVQLVDNDENKQDNIVCSRQERKSSTSFSSLPGMNKDFPRKEQHSKCWRILKVDFNLFKEKKFILYFFAAAIGQNASISPQTYFPPHAQDIGLGRKEGAYFVAIAGFADLGGRIITTLIADRTFLNRPRFLGMVLFSHGIIGCFIPLYKTFWSFSSYCIYYGASGGILFALAPTVLTDFIGERRLSQGLGLMYLFNGLLSSIYYPVLGYLRDSTESYDVGYGINSIALIFSGVLFLTEACIKHKKAAASEN